MAEHEPHLRDFDVYRYDVTGLSNVLEDALATLMVRHGLLHVPFCALEFILLDAIYLMHRGPRFEAERRRALVDFAIAHPAGMEQALHELFEQNPANPDIAAGLRINELKRAAHRPPEEELTVRALERYVVHLQCEDPVVIQETMRQFAKECKKMRAPERKSKPLPENCKAVQTHLFESRDTQTDTARSVGVVADDRAAAHVVLPEVALNQSTTAGKPKGGTWNEDMSRLNKQVHNQRMAQAACLEEAAALREEGLCAEREAELFRHELQLVRTTPLAASTTLGAADDGEEAEVQRPDLGVHEGIDEGFTMTDIGDMSEWLGG